MKVAFLCQNLSCTQVNAHSCSTAHCELFYFVYSFQFPHLGLFLTQFLSILFSGFVSKTGGDQKDSSREDEDKVENSILELVKLKSFR